MHFYRLQFDYKYCLPSTVFPLKKLLAYFKFDSRHTKACSGWMRMGRGTTLVTKHGRRLCRAVDEFRLMMACLDSGCHRTLYRHILGMEVLAKLEICGS